MLAFHNKSFLKIPQTARLAVILQDKLKADGFKVSCSTGYMTIADRKRNLVGFQNQTNIMVATNFFSKGIDIAQTTIVINYGVPLAPDEINPNVTLYLYRSTRCGRFGRRGISISLESKEKMQELASLADIQMNELVFIDPSFI